MVRVSDSPSWPTDTSIYLNRRQLIGTRKRRLTHVWGNVILGRIEYKRTFAACVVLPIGLFTRTA
jgi:hypothetical protein